MPCGLDWRFHAPLNCKPLTGHSKEWIERRRRLIMRKEWKATVLNTLPYHIRKMLTEGVVIAGEKTTPSLCTTTEENTFWPDPIEIATCLISKPTISQLGEEEEKVYCGMIYGPEYTIYKHQAKKKVTKTIEKFMMKYVPKALQDIRVKKKKNLLKVQKNFRKAITLEKATIVKECYELLKCKQKQMHDCVKLERTNTLLAKKGDMEKEIREVDQQKKEYLKDSIEFKIKYILKNKEQHYLERMNLYSLVWNKIFQKLQHIAAQKISEFNNLANQVLDEGSLKCITDKLKEDNQTRITEFYKEIQNTIKSLKAKILAEELHINEEKHKRERIRKIVNIWKSLFENVINLFDKVAFAAFKGRLGQCNYFITINIVEELQNLADEVEHVSEKSEKEHNETTKHYPSQKETIEKEDILSPERSTMTIDMGLAPPEEAIVLRLNLFKVKKVIEEATCLVMSEPLQIAEYMKDRSVELKPFEKTEELAVCSSYILNRLADAHAIVEKMLIEDKRDYSTFIEVPKDIGYTIESDPNITKRINTTIEALKSAKNPYLFKALTNV